MTFVVQLKGLPEAVTEDEILRRLGQFNLEIEHVRLVTDKSTGKFKGKALVKFKQELDAETFLADHPVIDLHDEPVWVERGFEHTQDDWKCSGCKSVNFSHRETCFKCGKKKPKPTKDRNASKQPPIPTILPGSDDISPVPSKFLLLQGTDEQLTGEQLFLLVKQFVGSVRRACLVADGTTGQSKGFAFLQFDSLDEAQQALVMLRGAGLVRSVQFGRDLCELALLSSLPASTAAAAADSLTYWDPGCRLLMHPPTFDAAQPSSAANAPANPKSHYPAAASSAFSHVPPVIFTISTRPVKRLQLRKWTQNAQQQQEAETEAKEKSEQNQTEKGIVDKATEPFQPLDFQTFTCSLCSERFESEAGLKAHAQQSKAHADKYDEFLKREFMDDDGSKTGYFHRDRAAERRNVFAIDEDEVKEAISAANDISSSSHTSNNNNNATTAVAETQHVSIGAKLLMKMGWKAGQGLGKDQSGIKEPIKAITVESVGAGLGAASLISADELATTSYTEQAKQGRLKRYKEAR